MKLTGAQIVIKSLERRGIKVIAGIPGGSNLPLYNALEESHIQHILARHEQSAGFIAQGISRVTGQIAVCFATSGPGVTNLLTAVADAKLDSIPIVAITGQVPSTMIGSDAFQEVDTYGLSCPITKHSYLVKDAAQLLTIIPEAFKTAESGRPGPVLIDIPKDVQNQVVEFDEWPDNDINYVSENISEQITEPSESTILAAAKMINDAKSPILYVGGGVIHSNSSKEIKELAEKSNIPVALTLMGLGAFPEGHPLYLGMLGMHASRYTNYLLDKADLIIAIGARFDDRATGRLDKFCPDARVIHVDIDPAEINKNRQSDLYITGNANTILHQIIPYINKNQRTKWTKIVAELKSEYALKSSDNYLHPVNIIKMVSSIIPSESIITTDVGQHQMWVAQAYPFKAPRTLLTSGGSGTMGFGLPTAIGAAIAEQMKDTTQCGAPQKVVCFTGDGSLLMNIQELDTLAEENLDVKVILFNNRSLGLVRQQQELFFKKKYIASKFRTNPDFAAIASNFNITSYHIETGENLEEILTKALTSTGPCFININIDQAENVLPMVPPGGANSDMIG